MPFNGAGVYTAPGADFPAVTQTVISSTHYNNVINDIATALSLTLTRDGQATVTGNIPFGGFRATNIGITGIAGSVGTPAINVSDAGTGLYRSAASELAVTVAGTQRGRFDATGLIVTGTVNASTSVVTPLVQNTGVLVIKTTDASQVQIHTNSGAKWSFIGLAGSGLIEGDFAPIAGDNLLSIGGPSNRVKQVFTPIIDSGTAGSLSLKTNNGTQQVSAAHVASAVNYWEIAGAATGTAPSLGSLGSDTDIGLRIFTKGAGTISFMSVTAAITQFQVLHTASANRNITVTGSNGGNPTIGVTAGSLAITPSVVITGPILQIGTNPSAASGLNTPYGGALTTRNSANSGDLTVAQTLTVNGQTDVVRIGGGIFSVDGAKSVQLFARAHAGVPTTSDIPAGNWMLWNDTSAVTYKVYFNDGATLRSVALA